MPRRDLTTPRHRGRLGVHYDPEAFGQFSEAIARFLGTARFLVIQTAIVIVWIAVNITVVALRFDPYPFILLNLGFSTQAAYAAPLILLAQNRQENRDRAQLELDRQVNARVQADTEFLARELASVRLALADVVTTGDLDDLARSIERLHKRLDELGASRAAGGRPGDGAADRVSAPAAPTPPPDATPR
jgi:uncharacterized membrane protein